MDLFDSIESKEQDADTPLAHFARPKNFDEYIGQNSVFKQHPYLKSNPPRSLLVWGPPGTGKTTLATVIAKTGSFEFFEFNAVLGGVNELKKIIADALDSKKLFGKKPLIFIDEIHRFNKAQQDALLPYLERGQFNFIGATTENPRSSVNKALISRSQVIELKHLESADILLILKNASKKRKCKVSVDILETITDHSNGDARIALNTLDTVLNNFDTSSLSPLEVKRIILENVREHDRNKDRHYDVISAFIKSLRGSDPDAALLWLAVMIDGGEDPTFIARRLVIFASEDVGNSDPGALNLAVSALQTVSQIGFPEARISLAQATTYLASTTKSNAAYLGINEALEYVRVRPTISVPNHLKNFPPKDAPAYQYPHSHENHFIDQSYTNEKIPTFYRPTNQGVEKNIFARLLNLWKNKKYKS